MRQRIPPVLAPLTVFGAALGMRLWGLGEPSFWSDEAFGFFVGGLSGSDILVALRADTHPPLFYWLIGVWRGLGESEASLRTLPVLAGLACLPLLAAWGRRMGGFRLGLWAMAFQAFSCYAAWNDTELRMWSTLTSLGLAASLALLKGLEEERRSWWVLYAFLLTLALYTSHLAHLVLVTHLLFVLLLARHRLGRLLGALALAGAAWLPFLPTLWVQSQSDVLAHLPGLSWGLIQSILHSFAGTDPLQLPLEMNQVLGSLLAAWILTGSVLAWKQGPAGRLAVLAFWIPVVALAGVTGLTSTPVLLARRMEFVFAPMMLLLASAASAAVARGGMLGAGSLGLTGVFLALNLWAWHTYIATPLVWRADWRSIAAEARKVQQPGDILVFCPAYSQIPFNYYYDRDRTRYRVVDALGTKSVEFLPGYHESGGLPQTYVQGPEIEIVAELSRRHRRLLLVGNQAFSHDPDGALFKWLNRHARMTYGVRSDNVLPGSRVYLGVFERTDGTAPNPPAP